VAGEQLIHQVPVGLGNPWMQQGGRGDDQDGPGLELASGSWRQQQAEVAVRDPARLQDLAEGVRAQLATARLLGSSRWMLAGSGYPAPRGS
jgi:hypothetical protein